MRPISEIVVHCTATPAKWREGSKTSDKVAEVRRWHVDPPPKGRGWSDIGYHLLIDRDGTVAPGRPLDRTGAHVAGHNTGTIGVALFGGHGAAATDRFRDHFTAAQDAALRKTIADLRGRFGPVRISGHNEYAAKGCPGFAVRQWFEAAADGGDAPAIPAVPIELQRARWRLAEIRDLASRALAGK